MAVEVWPLPVKGGDWQEGEVRGEEEEVLLSMNSVDRPMKEEEGQSE